MPRFGHEPGVIGPVTAEQPTIVATSGGFRAGQLVRWSFPRWCTMPLSWLGSAAGHRACADGVGLVQQGTKFVEAVTEVAGKGAYQGSPPSPASDAWAPSLRNRTTQSACTRNSWAELWAKLTDREPGPQALRWCTAAQASMTTTMITGSRRKARRIHLPTSRRITCSSCLLPVIFCSRAAANAEAIIGTTAS